MINFHRILFINMDLIQTIKIIWKNYLKKIFVLKKIFQLKTFVKMNLYNEHLLMGF